MKTTLTPHLRISPYKESVATVQIQMPFHAVGRSSALRAAHKLLVEVMQPYVADDSAAENLKLPEPPSLMFNLTMI